jgi:hypothetical protein
MYTIRILTPVKYYATCIIEFGVKMLSLTDSYYPTFLALGYCFHRSKVIVVCKVGNWRLRAMHEIGHAVGLRHTYQKGHVMHPWGIMRGLDGIDAIKTAAGDDYSSYMDAIV